MADHRHPFSPRLALWVALVLLGVMASANAQEAGLKNGAAALNSGNYDNAVRLLTSAVNSEGAAPAEAAKALYLRGIAYRKLGQPSRAIADLGAAIWLGLPGSDKVRAQVNRGLAYRSAGLSDQAEADFSAARRASSSGEVDKIISQDGAGTAVAAVSADVGSEESTSLTDRVRNAIPSFGSSETRTASPAPAAKPEASGAWSTSVSSEAAPAEGGSRVSRMWGSVTDVFSSSDAPAVQRAPAPASASAPAPTAAPSAAPTRTAAAPAASQAAAPSSWSTQVQDEDAGGESGTRLGRWISRNTGGGSETAPAPTQTAAVSGGGYSLQLANSRSEAEAKALWQQAAGKAPQLASARPQIEKVDIGNFGTFYSLKAGPFDRAQGQSLCNSLKRGGVDCSVVSPDGP
jgi:tetratricopeptide (TPR) repeat protein